jgi:hypothetical protein
MEAVDEDCSPCEERRKARERVTALMQDPTLNDWMRRLAPSEHVMRSPKETKPQCYIAGPMRGIEDWNYPQFREAQALLESFGWKVFSPVERDEVLGWDDEYPNARPLWEYMRMDLADVTRSDAVFFLPGWEKSEGAQLEFEVAQRLGVPCYHFTNGALIVKGMDQTFSRHPGSARFHEILKGLGELHDQKQADYGRDNDPFANVRGSEEWGVDPWIGAMVRANDKVRRLQSFIANGELKNESVEDSLRDLAVYAIIALVLFEERSEA